MQSGNLKPVVEEDQMRIERDGSSGKKVLVTAALFMGLSHILYFKQYIKGILYALLEIFALLLIPMFVKGFQNIITLGSPQPELSVRFRENSIFLLIDGIMMIAVLLIFFVLYIKSIKDAGNEYKYFCIYGLRNRETRNSVRTLAAKSFPLIGMAPAFVLVLFFVVVPLIFSAAVAFTNYSAPDHIPPAKTVDWVGMQNFVALFGGESTWAGAFVRVAVWTLIWGFLATLTCFAGGMIAAAVLHETKIRIKPVFRSLFILPYAVPIPWLSDVWICRWVCVLVNLWAGFSYFMLLIMGNMTSISADVYEAARIDGANKFYIFRKITVPLVLYQTMPLIIMSFAHNINNFGAIYFLTGGAPAVADSTMTSAGGTDILVTWIYQLTMTLMKYNYASVLGIVIFIVMAPFAVISFRNTKSYKEGEV